MWVRAQDRVSEAGSDQWSASSIITDTSEALSVRLKLGVVMSLIVTVVIVAGVYQVSGVPLKETIPAAC